MKYAWLESLPAIDPARQGVHVTLDRTHTILTLCEQLRRTATVTIHDDGHVSDPDLLIWHIRRHLEALAADLATLESTWTTVLAAAENLTVCDDRDGTDLATWLRAHAGAPADSDR